MHRGQARIGVIGKSTCHLRSSVGSRSLQLDVHTQDNHYFRFPSLVCYSNRTDKSTTKLLTTNRCGGDQTETGLAGLIQRRAMIG